MSEMGVAVATVAPLYNFVFVIISVFLFVKLFRIPAKRGFMLPWKLLFAVIMIFVLETVLTILRNGGLLPQYVYYFNGLFEFVMGILIVFLLLKQRENVQLRYL